MVIIIIAIVLFFVILFYKIYNDKISFIEIKLESIEEKINSTLIKRKEILKDSEIKIKELVKTKKDIYDNMNSVDNDINMFELDKKLLLFKNEFYLIMDKYNKVKDNNEIQKIAFALGETSDGLETYKAYYNKYAEKYNKYIKTFPILLFNVLKGRKKKEFFDEI